MDFGSATPTINTLSGARMWAHLKTSTVSSSLTDKLQFGEAKYTVNLGFDYENTRDNEFTIYSNGMGMESFDNRDLTDPVYPAWSEPVAPATPDQGNRYLSKVA